jgi:hypothetical protein
VREKKIRGVIISTDPLAHKASAKWALSMGLDILMDKPITTRMGVTFNQAQAEGIFEDYKDLLHDYLELQKNKETAFSINTQRRYELGYRKVFDLISEVSEKFNAPVTSIQAMHSDGVWILPDEVVDQVVHPYSQGYGKNSHSGYHLFDIIWQFYLSGLVKGKMADKGEVFSSFLMPQGLLRQFGYDDYVQYFGEGYKNVSKRSETELMDLYDKFGEIDSFSVIRLLKQEDNICNVSVNLLHNSFSRRSWMLPGKDLYKGNGRVRHQYYNIQQGPFQCVQIHSYQSNDKQDKSGKKDYSVGGDNHFDIYVFRNSEMFKDGSLPFQKFDLQSIDKDVTLDPQRLFHEAAKDTVILEFIKFVTGSLKKADLVSNITSHEIPVKIMSAIYRSHVSQRYGKNPLASFGITEQYAKN